MPLGLVEDSVVAFLDRVWDETRSLPALAGLEGHRDAGQDNAIFVKAEVLGLA